uniref:Replication origin-binding protein n=1 Tax=Human herpesvirus 3 TaxID=10335 RepID=A0A0F7GIR5_HHV3|nr:ORF51 [Human alphaherpesvirus 3]
MSPNTGESNAAVYASSTQLARALYGGDLVSWIKHTHPGISLELQLDVPVKLIKPGMSQTRPVTVVRAPMGSGKTTALLEWLQHALKADISVLVVSCRRSFTQTLIQRFNDAGLSGFVTYLTSETYIMGFKRLIVQLESLHRVSSEAIDSYDVLILDEVMSVIGQLYSPTMRRLSAVDSLLYRLLNRCSQIIAMDATVNSQFIDLISGLRGDENIHTIVCTYAGVGFSGRTCTILRDMGIDTLVRVIKRSPEHEDVRTIHQLRGTFFDELALRLQCGHNICIFSSTLSFSELVAQFCAIFTDSILILNSTRPLCNVNEWKHFRVLVYTTVVTVGLSFDMAHFHSMFAYIKPMSYGPDMVSVYQSLGRVRLLLLNEVLMYVDGSRTRCGPLFSPMLLNFTIANKFQWFPTHTQITNKLCCAFRQRCANAFTRSNTHLFSRFKYKHLFERCSLWSLADSINILQTLLASNQILVVLDGMGPITDVSPVQFCAFIHDLRHSANAVASCMRSLRQDNDSCLTDFGPSGFMADNITAFMEKYLMESINTEEQIQVFKALACPIEQPRLVNTAILGACIRIPEALEAFDVFQKIYTHYASGWFPVLDKTGEFSIATITTAPNLTTHWELFRRCAYIAKTLKWNPSTEGCVTQVLDTDINTLFNQHGDSLAQLIFEVMRCNVTDAKIILNRPVWRTTGFLDGCHNQCFRPIPTKHEYNIALFRLIWEQLFGARVTKSTQTFPGSTRVKNLKKKDLETLLDSINVDRSACRTYRQLYNLLMSHRHSFSQQRYKITAPAWARHVYFQAHQMHLAPHAEAMLQLALSELSPGSWPRINGAVNFESL